MSDILDRLRVYIRSDHARGCDGRCYACSCEYDAEGEDLHGSAIAEIERLRAALSAAPAQAPGREEVALMALDFVTEQSCGEWGEEVVSADAKTLTARILALLDARP